MMEGDGTATVDMRVFETAGPGPTVGESYRAKVHKALELLEPKIARWWQAAGGRIRSWVAKRWQFMYFGRIEDGRPVVHVDHSFVASQTAQAIINEAGSRGFGDLLATHYARRRFLHEARLDEFRQWRLHNAGKAARFSGVFAEWIVDGLASETPAGELVVTFADVAESGPGLEQLASILPIVGMLPLAAVVIDAGSRRVTVARRLARELGDLAADERTLFLRQTLAG
jgi:hypothetical protein